MTRTYDSNVILVWLRTGTVISIDTKNLGNFRESNITQQKIKDIEFVP
jgi:hypothetical protein